MKKTRRGKKGWWFRQFLFFLINSTSKQRPNFTNLTNQPTAPTNPFQNNYITKSSNLSSFSISMASSVASKTFLAAPRTDGSLGSLLPSDLRRQLPSPNVQILIRSRTPKKLREFEPLSLYVECCVFSFSFTYVVSLMRINNQLLMFEYLKFIEVSADELKNLSFCLENFIYS